MKKEILREKIREQTKDWYIQQGMFINEINNLKKSDQQENYLKNQESYQKLKEKILKKHKRHEKIVEEIKNNQEKLKKFSTNAEAEIFHKKEKKNLFTKEILSEIEKKPKNLKRSDEPGIFQETEWFNT
jgi:hypothetical protein